MPNASDIPVDGDAGTLIAPDLVARFRGDVVALAETGDARLGLAVSGGPDSMAMLALAAAAFPGMVEAATVDHGLRAEAAAEARMVAELCDGLSVKHATLTVDVARSASIQAAARDARYQALGEWCRDRRLAFLLTAHHADDQAETVLMRLSRGAGLGGVAGIRPRRDLDGIMLIRPLLGWRRAELAAIAAGLPTIDDPSNDDPRHDRTRFRRFLGSHDLFDVGRLRAVAEHMGDAEEALLWATGEAIRSRAACTADGVWSVDLEGLPRELRRRILARLVVAADSAVDGPTLEKAMQRLDSGQYASVGTLQLVPGRRITIRKAPERS